MSRDDHQEPWEARNQRSLMREVHAVRAALASHLARRSGDSREPTNAAEFARPAADESDPTIDFSALDSLAGMFGLTPFERSVLVLCAGVELDGETASLCAQAHGDPRLTYATFALALSALPDAHWSALAPSSPLRQWRLVEVDKNRVTQSALRIDERILHALAGIDHADERLASFVEPVAPDADVPPSHASIAEQIASTWRVASSSERRPVIQLVGEDPASKQAVVAALAAKMDLRVLRVWLGRLVEEPALTVVLSREAALRGALCWLDGDDLDGLEPARAAAVARLVAAVDGLVIWTCRERRPLTSRGWVTFEVARPKPEEQATLWREALERPAVAASFSEARTQDEFVEELVAQFSLSATALRRTVAEAQLAVARGTAVRRAVWDACRRQARPRLEDLAQRIEPRDSEPDEIRAEVDSDDSPPWCELILPPAQMQVLREMVVHVRMRSRVYGAWGLGAKSGRGQGISAVFAGPSGTGKTLAAEVIASELRLDLYRVDLSQVVSKYIGETEKNLRRVFDAAEEGGAVLLFDEADALFGTRSEVQDSHDRYANIEVSFLLQRMETYRGLAILTTNMKSAMDPAFARRIRFMVDFQFPERAERRRIWARMFPPSTPTEGLDFEALASLNVAGGNIRNIALYAAFLAAAHGGPVRMSHVLRAAQVEYQKLELPLTELLDG